MIHEGNPSRLGRMLTKGAKGMRELLGCFGELKKRELLFRGFLSPYETRSRGFAGARGCLSPYETALCYTTLTLRYVVVRWARSWGQVAAYSVWGKSCLGRASLGSRKEILGEAGWRYGNLTNQTICIDRPASRVARNALPHRSTPKPAVPYPAVPYPPWP